MATTGTDSHWSWVIAAACCWVTFVIQGLVRSGGVVYVALIDTYAVSRAQASWPFTLRMAVWNLSGPIAGALSYRWSIRTITFSGVLLVTITNIICWFAKDIYMVTFFLGGLQGLGVGLAVTLVPVMINQYFVKYKSTGAGIACAGATAGSFALPPVVEYAIEEYGLSGSFLMMAGITLHGILGAVLMRPAAWLSKKKTTANGNKETTLTAKHGDQNLNFLTKSCENANVEEVKCLMNGSCQKPTKTVRFLCGNATNTEKNSENEQSSLISCSETPSVLPSNKTMNCSEKFCTTEDKSCVPTESKEQYEHISTNQESNLPMLDESDNEQIASGRLQFVENEVDYDPQINLQQVYVPLSTTPCDSHSSAHVIYNPSRSPTLNGYHCYSPEAKMPSKWLKGIMEPVKAGCQIVKNPMFLIIASNYSIFFLSYMTYLIIIVDYSLDLGVDRTDCVFLVSTFSIADLIGRLGSGWITDGGIVKRKHLMMVNMILVGCLLVATSFATTYIAVTAVSVTTGLVVGVNLILFYALLEEYLGLRQLPMAIGLMNFSIGVISLVTPLLTGYFRDTMGSYDHLFHLLGGVSIFCGMLWTLEPFASRHKTKTIVPPSA